MPPRPAAPPIPAELNITGEVITLRRSLAPMTREVLQAWSAPEMRLSHNCMSFALAARGHGWMVPGAAAQNHFQNDQQKRPKGQWLKAALKADGLKRVRPHKIRPDRAHIVAAFEQADGLDYHLRRLGPCGTWFEKAGDGPAGAVTGAHDDYNFGLFGDRFHFIGYYKLPKPGIPAFRPDQLHTINVLLARSRWALSKFRL